MPGGGEVSQPPGAGHGEEGDALSQGPAQEGEKAQMDTLPAQPKPAYSDIAAAFDQEDAADEDDAKETADGAVIALATRIKREGPAQARAKTAALVQTHPKPPRRKNARERAKEKHAKDGTTPVMTAKAKSKAEKKTKKSRAAKRD
jgi:hypothetical protein